MIPLRSSEPHYTRPTVTLCIIAVNVAVFLYELSLGMSSYALNRFILHYGLVPDRFTFASILTSMFIHGGFLHIAGNMWFLWIFGRGVEDLIGHAKYLLLYFACGIIGAIVFVLVSLNSTVPTIGASGAIAGIMGAYLIKFPRARIVTLVFIVVFITTLDLPAFFLLLYWFALQFFNGVGSVAYSQMSQGGVAWFAHVGGFVAGMLLVMLMPGRYNTRPWRNNWRY
jgi:membrane associated rhomboid family serine protease